MIARSNPDIGYVADEVFKTFGFTQTIKAGSTLYLSGVAPLKGGLADLEIVGKGDMRAQIEWCLEVIKRCLAAEGATFRNWVAQTVYTTDIPQFMSAADVASRIFGNDTPTSTLIGVNALFHPDQMVEITGIAALE